jgi:GAF domain-containing protein
MARVDQLFVVLRHFASAMAHRYEVNDLLYELCDHAVQIFDATGAGVSVAAESDRLRFVVATTEQVRRIEQAQEDGQQGPCVTAFTIGRPVVVRELDEMSAWPSYRPAAEELGLHAVLGLPLTLGERRLGAMNVYNASPRDWDDDDLAAAQVLADMATASLLRAGELQETRRLSAQLTEALHSRVVIEQAKGMLARDHATSVDVAFERLRAYARRHQTSLRSVAQAVVERDLRIPHEDAGAAGS